MKQTLMKNPVYKNPFLPILLLVFLVTCSSCSRAPYPASYPFSSQHKMQSVNHWDILAHDTAAQLHRKLITILPSQPESCVSLQPDNSLFGAAFTQLLKANLLPLAESYDYDNSAKTTESFREAGATGAIYTIADEPDGQCAQVKFSAQVIKHRAEREGRIFPGTFTFLSSAVAVMRDFQWYEALVGAGLVADVLGGTANTLSHHEVLITTKITGDNRLLSMRTDMYYVNDQDSWHYEGQKSLSGKQFQMVGGE